MRKKSRPFTKKKDPLPRLSWQTGEFSRGAVYRLILPYEFLLLCRLMNVAPKKVLSDFVSITSSGLYEENTERCRQHVLSFLRLKYGCKQFSDEQIRMMYLELDRAILPDLREFDAPLLDAYEHWKDQFLHHWFKKWSKVSAHQTPLHSPS